MMLEIDIKTLSDMKLKIIFLIIAIILVSACTQPTGQFLAVTESNFIISSSDWQVQGLVFNIICDKCKSTGNLCNMEAEIKITVSNLPENSDVYCDVHDNDKKIDSFYLGNFENGNGQGVLKPSLDIRNQHQLKVCCYLKDSNEVCMGTSTQRICL